MKKVLSLLQLFVILLNILGYYGIFFGLQYTNTRKMIREFDKGDYDVSKAVTIKIPITIPYAVDSRSFERVDGTFEHNGEFYRLIKQTLYKDTLRVMCIRDERQKEIHQAFVNYTGTVSDHNNAPGSTKSIDFIKDYLSDSFTISSTNNGWETALTWRTMSPDLLLSYFNSIAHPPERA